MVGSGAMSEMSAVSSRASTRPNTSTILGKSSIAAVLLAATLVPAAAGGAAQGAVSAERAAAPRTELTFTVDDCEGCEIQLTSALGTIAQANAGKVDIWSSKTRTVEDGSVTFDIATRRTWGMSVAVRARGRAGPATARPWPGGTKATCRATPSPSSRPC